MKRRSNEMKFRSYGAKYFWFIDISINISSLSWLVLWFQKGNLN